MQRDPIGYQDGMNLYVGYFVPKATDPKGLLECGITSATVKPGQGYSLHSVYAGGPSVVAGSVPITRFAMCVYTAPCDISYKCPCICLGPATGTLSAICRHSLRVAPLAGSGEAAYGGFITSGSGSGLIEGAAGAIVIHPGVPLGLGLNPYISVLSMDDATAACQAGTPPATTSPNGSPTILCHIRGGPYPSYP